MTLRRCEELDRGDVHNSSHHTTAKFNNCFIIHSKYFEVLNKLTSLQTYF